MSNYPPGVTTATIRVGTFVDFYGDAASVTAKVKPVLGNDVSHIVHAPTGTAMIPASRRFDSDLVSGFAEFELPHVDGPGWTDPAGNTITHWYYTITVTATLNKGFGASLNWTKTVQPLAGQDVIDLELVPSGEVSGPVFTEPAAVLSLNGQTGHVVFSGDGATDAALAANLDAAKAHTDTELAERFGDVYEPGIAFAVVDEDGRRTWIEAADDGGPTAHAAEAMTAAVGPAITAAVEAGTADIGFAELNTSVTDMAFAVVDEDNRRTWIEAGRDGKPTPRTLETLRASLALSAAPSGVVVCSGDSMTGGAFGTNYPTHLANLTGWTVINDGVGGENTTTIAGRMGGRPMLVDPVNIPASGGVTVTLKSDDGIDTRGVTPLLQQDGGTNPVRIAGVEGTLTVNKTLNPPVYTFTRSAAGSAVTVNYPTPLITRAMREHNTGIHVMWWATNDTSVTNNDAQHIIDRERALIEHLAEADPRYLVIGFTTGTASWRAPADVQFLRAFGRRYLNLGAYLSSPAAMQDAGLTPTAEDTSAQATGTVPPSLRGDNTHLNNAGNLLVARQVAARITEMGWK